MSEDYLIIGDIAGQYEALLKLVAQVPDALPFSVGDMCDRGPRSKDVFEFFKNNGKALLGNHEHMLLDFFHDGGYYDEENWFYNGGGATIKSFQDKDIWEQEELREILMSSGTIDYLESLPFYFVIPAREDGLKGLITHAPLLAGKSLEEACNLDAGFGALPKQQYLAERTIIWNRGFPGHIKDTIQIFGHNSPWGHSWFQDQSAIEGSGEIIPWGVCLDSSRDCELTAIHWPSLKIYQQPF
jgi:hypothetical protein